MFPIDTKDIERFLIFVHVNVLNSRDMCGYCTV